MAVKPSNIFYVLRICERPSHTDRQTVHTHTHTHIHPLPKYVYSLGALKLQRQQQQGLKKKSRYNITTATPWRTHIKVARRAAASFSLSSLSFCLSIPLNLSGEIKTDQNVIFKSLNLYKIASRKPKRGTTKTLAKQATQRCLPTNSLTCLSVCRRCHSL